ncbi:nitronate monooxygenase [Rhodococcus triatomae]|uniref:Propionate 3-nitronate monooxygenase n=1 Tax=Rhodococcus triatomae TaxID=300028 RepID=A0A1G8L0F0_9NOCA|nr:nitronate monooxygenase [Rhodococcus triatomae]QNG20474.1 nitronate monooxygenase [Rhodococcus triatomae]QNG23608.1 nitronate monooxygenase [Rhodococcus triatomae]SDI49081.1 nitronate monooxygenase [Rhodococcus triatomae]
MNDWTRTPFTDLLGVRYPIVQGPFGGGISRIALTAAVSEAGGLGSFGAHHLHPHEVDATIARLQASTDRPFAVNLWVPLPGEPTRLDPLVHRHRSASLAPWFRRVGLAPEDHSAPAAVDFEAQVDAVLARKPAVFSFVFGVPRAEILAECRRLGIRTVGAATHLDEGLALQDAGVDAVVASGYEAGGHRPAFLRPGGDTMATGPLTARLSAALTVPVIAAGGITDGRGVASAMILGAAAVQLGTAFLATDQSGAPEVHKEILRSPRARYTTLTRAFSGRLARGVRNEFLDEQTDSDGLLPYPQQSWVTAPLRAAAAARGDAELLALWSGQGAPVSADRRDATEVFEYLVADTARTLATATGSRTESKAVTS